MSIAVGNTFQLTNDGWMDEWLCLGFFTKLVKGVGNYSMADTMQGNTVANKKISNNYGSWQ